MQSHVNEYVEKYTVYELCHLSCTPYPQGLKGGKYARTQKKLSIHELSTPTKPVRSFHFQLLASACNSLDKKVNFVLLLGVIWCELSLCWDEQIMLAQAVKLCIDLSHLQR